MIDSPHADALCADCPDLPNGTRKRSVCCRRAGQLRELRIGDRVPLPTRKLVIRPNAPVDNRSSFRPVRGPKK